MTLKSGVACLFALHVVTWAAQPGRPQMGALFAAYAAGRYDELSRADFARVSPADLSAARKLSEDRGGVAPEVAAAFLLELVQGYSAHATMPGGDGLVNAARTFEAACTLARRSGVPATFTAAFQRASLSAISGRGVLRPSRQFDFDGHVRHAGEHIQVGEAALIKGTFAEGTAMRFLDVYLPSLMNSTPDEDPLGFAAMVLKNSPRRNRVVVDALDLLAEAAVHPLVRAEALVRSALLKDAAGRPDEALVDLASAGTANPDAWVRYLIAFARGRALERLGQPQAAQAEFRRAIAENSGGRSALLALSANLYLAGRPHGTDLDAALAPASDDAIDPWAEYVDGHRRFWLERRDAMRKLLP